MQSKAPNVNRYLDEVPVERKAALTRLRRLCVDTLAGYEECMGYGIPGYKRPGGEIEVSFASQANYISLYMLRKDVLDRFRDRLTTAKLGKGCIRYSTPDKIDFDVVAEMLEASTQSGGEICD